MSRSKKKQSAHMSIYVHLRIPFLYKVINGGRKLESLNIVKSMSLKHFVEMISCLKRTGSLHIVQVSQPKQRSGIWVFLLVSKRNTLFCIFQTLYDSQNDSKCPLDWNDWTSTSDYLQYTVLGHFRSQSGINLQVYFM